MRINTNVSALTALGNLNKVQDNVASSMQKLSSGFRINKAGDDAAGLGISNQMGADIKAMTQASRNAEQAGSVLQIMDGATSNIQTILERMKELAAQSASDTVDAPARTKINSEFSSLSSELDRISATTKFQGASLLDGTFGSKTTNLGTVDADSTLTAAPSTTHVASAVAVSDADKSKFAGIAGDITATVVKKDNTLGTLTNGDGDPIDVPLVTSSDLSAKINSLDASKAIGLTVVWDGYTGTTDAGTSTPGGATLGSVSVGSDGLAPVGKWSVSDVKDNADDNSKSDITFFDGNISYWTVTGVADNATSITLDTTSTVISLDGTFANHADVKSLIGANLDVARNYTISASGGGVDGGASQAIVEDGTTDSTNVDFTGSYGFSFDVATGTAFAVDGASVGLKENDQLVLTAGTDTASADISNTAAGAQNFDFTNKFGLTITSTPDVTGADLKTGIGDGKTITHDTSKQAQFLVSSSQSYAQNDLISIDAINLTVAKLGLSNVDLTTAAGAQTALSTIDSAINDVGTALGSIGAAENRVTYADTNVKTTIQNLTAAQSAIKDVDMAQEMTTFSKNQILSQASTAMLAQANQLGQSVLKLLQ